MTDQSRYYDDSSSTKVAFCNRRESVQTYTVILLTSSGVSDFCKPCDKATKP
jgi:hypothetical protein